MSVIDIFQEPALHPADRLHRPTTPSVWLRVGPARLARLIWFGFAAAVNLAALTATVAYELSAYVATWSLISLAVTVAVRNEAVVRGLYRLTRRTTSYAAHQLIYHLGQAHRAFALAGMAWLMAAVVVSHDVARLMVTIGTVVVVGLLATMAATARSRYRESHHDSFEIIHRSAGWTAIVITAAVVGANAIDQTTAGASIGSPTIAVPLVALGVIVVFAAEPWWGVRRLRATVAAVTDEVVVLELDGSYEPGDFVRISRDGREWHSFAASNTGNERPGHFSLLIRRAGDWTNELGDDASTAGQIDLWIRRVHGHGFMHHVAAHDRALVFATGAGIAPVLPYLSTLAGHGRTIDTDVSIVWVTREADTMVGPDLAARILDHPAVTLADTANGRPNLAALVEQHLPSNDSPVFMVSNAAFRDELATVCEARSTNWYGPTFDS